MASSDPIISPEGFRMLDLPTAVLHQLLDSLKPGDLASMLQTSKAMAKQILQHSPDLFTFKVDVDKHLSSRRLAAIKQLLQWAPPACLKLTLDGTQPIRISETNAEFHYKQMRALFSGKLRSPKKDWKAVSSLFDSSAPTSDSLEDYQLQQFPCIKQVYIMTMSLPGVVPAGLAASCPNLGKVRLYDCKLNPSNDDSKSGSHKKSKGHSNDSGSSSSAQVGGGSADGLPAQSIHTLVLTDVEAPQLNSQQPRKIKGKRKRQAVVDFGEQLKSSIPSVRRLTLNLERPTDIKLLTLLGPQLQELVLPGLDLADLTHIAEADIEQYHAVVSCLQNLRQLSLPDTSISTAPDMEFLLSLPNLRRVALGTVSGLSRDYSNRACKQVAIPAHQAACECRDTGQATSSLPHGAPTCAHWERDSQIQL